MNDELMNMIMGVAKGMASEGVVAPVMLLKIAGRSDMVCTNPDMSTPETKSNTVDLIKRMISSGDLEEFVLVCEANRSESADSEKRDCILIMRSSRSSETLYVCDIIRGEGTSFGEWSVCSDSSPLRQGALNNLFDRVLCSSN